MEKIWTYLIDVFIALLVIFVSVAIYFGLRTETVMKTIGTGITDEFIEEVKRNGSISVADYEGYLGELFFTDSLYELEFEHVHTVSEPEYRFRTIEEIIEAQNAAYTGENIYHYHEVETEVPVVDDPDNSGSLNTDTNESILARAVNTPASPSHVHTDACFNGTKHIHTGNSTSGGGCYGQSNPSTRICGSTDWIAYPMVIWSCSKCPYSVAYIPGYNGNTSHGYNNETHVGTMSPSGSTDHWRCGTCGDGGYSSKPTGACTNMISAPAYSLNCGKTEGAYYIGNVRVYEACGLQVVSITPTNPVQTVATGDPLITTVVAIYRDGSTKTVVCTASFSTATVINDQTVLLTYTYSINGIEYSVSCTIKVTVVPRTAVCINGHTYNRKEDGSDPGCPYCREWIRSLRIIYPQTSTMTITLGTTLQDNGVTLLATYLDGHTETVATGYVDNLDTGYLGTKPVTIGYKGKTVQLMVTTICIKMVCDICGFEYNLYPDGTNPGCPRCIQKTPVFTGNVLRYEEAVYTDEILNIFYSDGRYDFINEDTFTITLNNKSSSIARNILNKLYPALSDRWFSVKVSERIGAR